MAYRSMFFETRLPKELCDCLITELSKATILSKKGTVGDQTNNTEKKAIRDSDISWIQDDHWVAGMLWHYLQRANIFNWKYDLWTWDQGTLQLTTYGPGQHYRWHQDSNMLMVSGAATPISQHPDPSRDLVRKLSVSLILTEAGEDHEGGEFQLMAGHQEMISFPAKRGQIIVFDSTMTHRVRPVKSGRRASIVGWAVGPRWR